MEKSIVAIYDLSSEGGKLKPQFSHPPLQLGQSHDLNRAF